MTRAFLALLGLLLVAPQTADARPPRLTLWITVDGLSSDLLLRHRHQLSGGLATLMDRGAYFPTARYAFAEPGTGPGHSTLATGANPWRHGIVSNRIYDRATGIEVPVFSHPDHPVIGAEKSQGDVSPHALEAETIGERLRLASRGQAKVVAIAGKGRASIPFAGRLGKAYWFDEPEGRFVTSTFYGQTLPVWVDGFNARKLPHAYFTKTWPLSKKPAQYDGKDDRAFEADILGLGRTFPHPLNGGLTAPGPKSFSALTFTPHFNDVTVQFARAAIAGEKLGADAQGDLLSVSFSGTDKAQHLFGPFSWEMQDALFRLDAQVGELLAAAEKAAGGKQHLLVVLSADHGSAAIPEAWAEAGQTGVRVSPRQLAAEVQRELQTQFGGEVTVGMDETDLYLGGAFLERRAEALPEVRRAAASILARHPSVALALSRDDRFSAAADPGLLAALQRGFHPLRSGDVLYAMRAFHVPTDEVTGTNHGTPWTYDTDVPVLLYGKGVRPGTYAAIIDPVDVAPTVASVLEIGSPASAEGAVRAEALTGK